MEAITTSLTEKLPEAVRPLLSEAQPLPTGTTFFEERFTLAPLAKRGLLGLALLMGSVLLIPIGVMYLFSPSQNLTVADNHSSEWWIVGFGAVLGFAGWMLAASVPACLDLRRQQQAGRQTRYGLFLIPGMLVQRSYFDTTVIPQGSFRGLDGSAVRYEAANVVKSFSLPAEWIGTTPALVVQAVHAWSQSVTAPPPTFIERIDPVASAD